MFRVWGLGFRVWGLGFMVSGLGFRVWGLVFGVGVCPVLDILKPRTQVFAEAFKDKVSRSQASF